ncbi:UDP-galactopyranose mutase [Pontibacter sp. FD36]|uniref:UDP-galactopyranose mutase n=1 Tax=Pontibacter sp. FD36 TaxID=2789860 RepID=UPI0018AB2D48|nr:UDP-galactopyranose mutase [Pontibacter sp. FD36]MBF8964580.1 UDP-galactopyranose mutase [Pontibacter sp. FD36]
MYDYLIVGAGMYGATFAREMTDKGKKCLVIDRRSHIAGNCYTENKEGINIHKYGAHIFHTDDENIWNYVQRFAEFNNFKNSPRVRYKDKIYSFPINLFTLYQIYGVQTPEEARQKLEEVRVKNDNPQNLEEWILSQVGEEIYDIFIKGYTTKQWMKDPKELPSFIIKRLPIRLNFNDNYFFDRFQGIPIGGYTKLFENLLSGIEVQLDTDYFADRDYFDGLADKVVFTGRIDEFYNYRFGELEYRTLRFEHSYHAIEDYQGNAVVNYTELDIPYTRIIEHKHFEFGKQPYTYVTKEYPEVWQKDSIPYYPINDDTNTKIFNQYKTLSKEETKYIFGGRLADYRYYDMHQVIGSALAKVRRIEETISA